MTASQRSPTRLGIAFARSRDMTQTQPSRSNARYGTDKIRGRHHGFDTEWSHERFADVIRRDVTSWTGRGWAVDRIWRCIRSLYEVDERSCDEARAVLDEVLHRLRGDGVLPRHRM